MGESDTRGEYGNEWPWGNEPPDPSRCNFDKNVGDTTPIGKYSPLGDSPYGCVDMAGNVWEWTHTAFEKYPYKAGDGRESEEASGLHVLRGGSFSYSQWYVRCACRLWIYPDVRYDYGGFRILASPIHL